ncbi:hydrolase [Wenjunlia vitaminophila]|uniref:Hydrolase n=1 Tax=Wenjunlia vitaminophila TaxID=76728 RepID=A0A0T6LW03_WENVI|nr:HAD family phosphatase [Wenjunlia vitaminophila]KRV50246.1 hydrolase [Wenjunlia vitaminophila]
MTNTIPAGGLRTSTSSGLRAVLLDMDGTLVDTEGFWWDAEVEVFAELGHELRPEYRAEVAGGPMTRVGAFLLRQTGARITYPELSRLVNDRFAELIGRGVTLMPGAQRLLAELATYDVPIALVSASHRRIIDVVLQTLGSSRFAFSLAGDEVENTKPHPEPYLTAARRMEAPPESCLVVEDTPTGVTSARSAGCQVLAVPSVAPIDAAPGCTVVRSLEDVNLTFLRSLVPVAR